LDILIDALKNHNVTVPPHKKIARFKQKIDQCREKLVAQRDSKGWKWFAFAVAGLAGAGVFLLLMTSCLYR